MLGLDSDIKTQEQISSISAQYSHNKPYKHSNPSTNYDSNCQKQQCPQQLQLQSYNRSYQHSNSHDMRQLKNKLNELEYIQENLDYKMNSLITILQNQLIIKEQSNKIMYNQIKQLRKDIEESRADIETLSTLLNKRIKIKEKINNNIQNNHVPVKAPKIQKQVGNLNKEAKKIRSPKKLTSNSPLSKRILQKPTSPQHKSQYENLIEATDELKKHKGSRNSAKLGSSSPFRKQKLMKSP